MPPVPAAYSRAQIYLHWVIVVLIGLQFLLNETIGKAFDAKMAGAEFAFNPLIAQHVFTGIALAVLVVARVGRRKRHGVPAAPAGTDPRLARLATLAHIALNLMVLVTVATGGMAWFGGITAMAGLHELAKALLMALIAAHVGAALYHHYVLKDNLIARMNPHK